ncbi:MAG: thioredoxin family protein [Planctomycetes bacterium]|nr:thioredoxin family protein [Planctomycetota bacterium]
MRVPTFRPATLLIPLVTAAALAFPSAALAAEPVNWRTDYNAARKEAIEKGLSLCVVIGTDNCFYCRKLEGGPLKDAAVATQLANNFIPLKLDANKDPNIAKALKVQLYPTIVLAGADGKIHAFIEGYLEADRLNEAMKRTISTSTTPDWIARDFEQATKALAASEYPRAVSLLKGIIREAADKPVGVKAKQVLAEVEQLAAGRLAKAKELEQAGLTQESLDTLAEAVKTYAGTQAAADAATLMTGLAANPETREKLRSRAARDLLASARQEFRTSKFYDCLQKCEQLGAAYADLSESKEANAIAAEIKNNPERLATACDQMNERTAAMYMTLAEAWSKKGQLVEAVACYEKVAKLCPNTRQGDVAIAQMTKLRANGNATPASLQKP